MEQTWNKFRGSGGGSLSFSSARCARASSILSQGPKISTRRKPPRYPRFRSSNSPASSREPCAPNQLEDNTNPNEPIRLVGAALEPGEYSGIRERYKTLIRHLPAKVYIDQLVDVYFDEFNWQYYPLDRDVFMRQLDQWNSLPFNVLNTQGPSGLSPDMRAFPAMLFQVLATALLVLPAGSDPTFDALKLVGNMTFEDFVRVLKPKVEGSARLDELFSDANLDFFIMLSSTASLIGNAGQSNYSAANMVSRSVISSLIILWSLFPCFISFS